MSRKMKVALFGLVVAFGAGAASATSSSCRECEMQRIACEASSTSENIHLCWLEYTACMQSNGCIIP
ncbi:hypothetical protein [Coralloluteibacterium thermophilus]|uniref:Uncharacterized protein n=1 Tax=Coralloluteibacterium thermophilum TaxID=2707049 RepID=A0ABV9NKG7_9GAMM